MFCNTKTLFIFVLSIKASKTISIMINFTKERLGNQILHVAYDTNTLEVIRITEAKTSKEIVLDDYDFQIINERILDLV